MTENKKTSTRKEFTDKFFDLFREFQEGIQPHKIVEGFRDYSDRLD